MSSCELVTLVSALACSIAKTFTKDETALLAAIFTQLGDTLATIDASDAINNCNDKDEG
ncbi:MAG: DUF6774 domain-containing protein [Clostridia bacterium]|nr:DUF6774 domain-containing protein [Clostridia bacterium]